MDQTPARHDAANAVPYPLRVAAAMSWRILVVIGVLVVVGYVLITLRVVVVPVALALLLTAALGPVVDWLQRHRVPRGLATTVVLIAGLAAIGGLLAFVVQAFVSGLPDLRRQLGDSVGAVRDWLDDPPFGLPSVRIDSLIDSATMALSDNRATVTSGALSTAFTVGEFLTGAALALFTLIYFLYGGGSMWRFLIRIVPPRSRHRVDVAGQRSYASLVGYVRATLLVAVVDAVGIGAGLLAVGAPLAVPLTALVFLSAFIPVVGAVVSGVVAVLVVLVANGPVAALIVLAVVLGVQQLEGNVLQPLLLGKAVSLNGVAVVLAVAIGTVLAGITGALLAVPLLAAVNAGVRSLVGDNGVAPAEVDPNDPREAATSAHRSDEPDGRPASDAEPDRAPDRASDEPAGPAP